MYVIPRTVPSSTVLRRVAGRGLLTQGYVELITGMAVGVAYMYIATSCVMAVINHGVMNKRVHVAVLSTLV